MVLMSRTRPHELLLFVVSVLTGIVYLDTLPDPRSLAALVPEVVIRVWAGGLLASGALGLFAYALLRSRVVLGLKLEGSALLIGSGALLMYVVSVFSYAGLHALFTGAIVLGWLIANLVRVIQIIRDLGKLGGRWKRG